MTLMKKVYGTVVPPYPKPNMTNYEGTPAYEKSLKEKVVQVAFCGFPGNTFYKDQNEVMQEEVVKTIEQGLKAFPVFTVKAIAIGRSEGFVKFPAQICAALLKSHPALLEKYFDKLILIPTDLFAATTYMVNRSGGKTGGRVWKRVVGDWLNKHLTPFWASKYAGNNAGFSLADIIRTVHPFPPSMELNTLYQYITARDSDVKNTAAKSIHYLASVNRLGSVSSTEAAHLIRTLRIPHEAVTGRVRDMNLEVWAALIDTMPMTALLRNLNTAVANLGPATPYAMIRDKFTPDNIRKAKILPSQIIKAYDAVYAQSRSLAAILSEALDASADNLPVITEETVIGIDASVSMRGTLLRDACILGFGMNKLYPNSRLYTFSEKVEALRYNSNLPILAQALSVHVQGGTRTDLMMDWVTPSTKNLVILTDGQENDGSDIMGKIARWRAQGHALKVFVVDISTYTSGGKMINTDGDPNSYYAYGMNDSVWKFIAMAASGFGSMVENIEGRTI